MKKSVLGIKVDDINMDQALEKVLGWLKGKGKYYIVTPNPEIVVMAQKDQDLKKIINQADLAIPDGAGLRLSGDIVCTTGGIDFMERLIEVSAEKGFTGGLLGGREGVAEKAAECLKKKYPKLKILFADSGGEVNEEGIILRGAKRREDSIKNINSSYGMFSLHSNNNFPPTDLLFVAFGPPKQEKWIAKNLPYLNVKVAMGVGGAFDYISGSVPRAPKWLRNLGMEWLFRLIIQPWRIKRQLNLLKFIFYVLANRSNNMIK